MFFFSCSMYILQLFNSTGEPIFSPHFYPSPHLPLPNYSIMCQWFNVILLRNTSSNGSINSGARTTVNKSFPILHMDFGHSRQSVVLKIDTWCWSNSAGQHLWRKWIDDMLGWGPSSDTSEVLLCFK